MTIVPDKDLRSALQDALLDAFPTTPIAWENFVFNPTVGTIYFRVKLHRAGTDPITLGQNPWQERSGVFQVSVFAAINTGPEIAEAKAIEVQAAFKPHTSFVYNGLTVSIDKTELKSGLNDDSGWYSVPVDIRYRCYFAD